MIRRRIEYVRYCDVEDCREGAANAEDWRTREECETASLREGWVKMTYGRWACPECARKLGFATQPQGAAHAS